MSLNLKPIERQLIVITGATSGIGLVTARMAAKRGARLFLISRNEEALRKLTDELNSSRGDMARFAVADVADETAINYAADEAVRLFGRIDTWVNNAGVSIYGKLEEVETKDLRQVFETNVWGVVNGSLAALKHMKREGGAIINIGSTLSDVAIPIQGIYCASKHAVKGFTDAFRMEIEADDSPISVSLIKPSAIDTPYKDHAKNYLDVKPENPPPVYAPETVAEAILHCAENPVRDVFVGAGGKAMSMAGNFAPRTTDKIIEATMIDIQEGDQPAGANSKEGLYESRDASLTERGDYAGHVSESSVYTKASLHPVLTGTLVALAAGAAAVAVGAALSRGSNGGGDDKKTAIPLRKRAAAKSSKSSKSKG